MGKYEQDARLLLEYVGGKENIAAVSHCVSRMLSFALCMLIAIVVPFVLTVAIGKKKGVA